MYHLNPINDNNLVIDLPTCMYPMKSVHLVDNSKNMNQIQENGPLSVLPVSCNKNEADVSEDNLRKKNLYLAIQQQVYSVLKKTEATQIEMLEQRQHRILQQLKQLKEKLLSMHKELNICRKPFQPKITEASAEQMKPKPINTKCLQEIVINANPKAIPYSLLEVKKFWQKRINLNVHIFTHSTICEDLPAEVKNFNNQLTVATETEAQTDAILSLVVIWKDTTNMELIASGSSYPILGEINILRYLMRIGPNEWCHESYKDECTEIDGILDACDTFMRMQTIKEKLQNLKQLKSKLIGKQKSGSGSAILIANIAVDSAIRRFSK